MSSKIIGAFEKGQNDFRKMNLPLYFLKKRLGGKEEERIKSLPLPISLKRTLDPKKTRGRFQNYRVITRSYSVIRHII